MKIKKLVNIAELGRMLGWSTEKTNTYYSRGKFEPITPSYMVGNRPAWTVEQAWEIVNKIKG